MVHREIKESSFHSKEKEKKGIVEEKETEIRETETKEKGKNF